MSLPNGNGFGDGQNGYPAGYGPNNNRQNFQGNTVEHYPHRDLHQQHPYIHSSDSKIPNPTFQNQYQGQQLQQSYNYRPNNYAPQFIDQSSQNYIQEQHHQQQPIPHRSVLANSPPITVNEVSSVPHQPFHQQYHRLSSRRSSITNSQPNPPVYHPHSTIEIQQYQTSPQNFQVPSNTTTQNSNESYLFEGNTLTDISSSKNPCQNSAVPVTHPINKSLEDINMDEMIQILDECNWNPNLTNDSSLVYEIPPAADEQAIIDHQRNAIENDNVATFYPQNAFQRQRNSPPAYIPLFPQENRIVANV
uniref:Uncharacterized protein n=1 Tax=Panagrolaimus davidi TaxID=227884 RepID=A0A914PDW0_9BILA